MDIKLSEKVLKSVNKAPCKLGETLAANKRKLVIGGNGGFLNPFLQKNC